MFHEEPGQLKTTIIRINTDDDLAQYQVLKENKFEYKNQIQHQEMFASQEHFATY